VVIAVAVATTRLFSAALRTSAELKISSYQRNEKPSNGNDSAAVLCRLNSTTTSSGAQRKRTPANVKTPARPLRPGPVTSRTSCGRAA
jgi:hypothetical protein